MATYSQKAINGFYGRTTASNASDSGDNHFYFGGTNAFSSIICFSRVKESTNIVLQKIKLTFQRDGSSRQVPIQIYMAKRELVRTDTYNDTSLEDYLKIYEGTLDFSSNDLQTIEIPISDLTLFNDTYNYWFKIIGTGNEGRVDGYNQTLAPVLTFDYSYGIITGQLNKVSFNLGETVSVSIKNPNPSMLSASYVWKIGNGSEINGESSLTLGASSYGNLFSEDSTQIEGYVKIYTNPGNISSVTLNFTINLPPSYGPILSDINISTFSLNQKRDSLSVKFSSTPQYNAKITSNKIQLYYNNSFLQEYSGESYTFSREIFSNAGSYKVRFAATDSRGYSTILESETITVKTYTTPYFTSVNAQRTGSEGKVDLLKGTYVFFTATIEKGSASSWATDIYLNDSDIFSTIGENKESINQSIYNNLSTESSLKVTAKLFEYYNEGWVLCETRIFNISSVEYMLHFYPAVENEKRIGSLGIGTVAKTKARTINIGWPVYLNGGLGEPLKITDGGTGVTSLGSLATNLASESAFTQKYIQNSNPILNGMIINSANNSETYDLNFQNPSSYIYQANLDVCENNFRIKSYNTSTKVEREPVWVNLETGETWLTSLRLDNPNIVLQNGTLLTYSFSEPTVVVGGLWLKPV